MEGRKREVHRGRDTCIACTRSRMSRRGGKRRRGVIGREEAAELEVDGERRERRG